MKYLKSFTFPSEETESASLNALYQSHEPGETYYSNTYPFRILSGIGLRRVVFDNLTIFCGGNGSGKSTALNVISSRLHASRLGLYNRSSVFERYVDLCDLECDSMWTGEEFNLTGQRSSRYDIGSITHVITSDDIFKMMLQERTERDQKYFKSRMLINEAVEIKNACWLDDERISRFTRHLDLETGAGVNEYRKAAEMRKKSYSRYLRDNLGSEEVGMSNGETSLKFITDTLKEEGLYLLDEPENSLSAKYQMTLARLIDYMLKNNNIQIVMATHSPFLLSIPGAKIYDLDAAPAAETRFEDIENMQIYYGFFSMLKEKYIFRSIFTQLKAA